MSSIVEPSPGLSYARDDVVRLAPPVEPAGPDGLNDAASLLVQTIADRGEVALGDLADLLVATYDLEPERAFHDVAAFVHRAQLAGVLSMRSSWTRQVRHSFVFPLADLVMLLVRLGFPERGARREYRSATTGSTTRLALASQVPFALALAVPFAAVLWLVFQPPSLGQFLLGFGGLYVVLMAVTAVVHELAHLGVARLCGLSVETVFRERSTVGLRRSVGSPAQELAVTAAGPVAALAVLVTLLAWLTTAAWDADAGVLVRGAILAALAASTFHLACLLPPSADGRALAAAVRGLRR